MTHSIMTLSIWHSIVMLNVTYAERHKEALYDECLYAECRYAECRGALSPKSALEIDA